MNKTDLVAAMADQAELSKKDAEKALKAFVDVITDIDTRCLAISFVDTLFLCNKSVSKKDALPACRKSAAFFRDTNRNEHGVR